MRDSKRRWLFVGNGSSSSFPVLFSFVIALGVFGLPAQASGEMSENQARAAAARILKGDPYGNAFDDIMRNIKSAELVVAGTTLCGPVKRAIWQFQISVPKSRNSSGGDDIEGPLLIDARTGTIVCAGLPFLE